MDEVEIQDAVPSPDNQGNNPLHACTNGGTVWTEQAASDCIHSPVEPAARKGNERTADLPAARSAPHNARSKRSLLSDNTNADVIRLDLNDGDEEPAYATEVHSNQQVTLQSADGVPRNRQHKRSYDAHLLEWMQQYTAELKQRSHTEPLSFKQRQELKCWLLRMQQIDTQNHKARKVQLGQNNIRYDPSGRSKQSIFATILNNIADLLLLDAKRVLEMDDVIPVEYYLAALQNNFSTNASTSDGSFELDFAAYGRQWPLQHPLHRLGPLTLSFREDDMGFIEQAARNRKRRKKPNGPHAGPTKAQAQETSPDDCTSDPDVVSKNAEMERALENVIHRMQEVERHYSEGSSFVDAARGPSFNDFIMNSFGLSHLIANGRCTLKMDKNKSILRAQTRTQPREDEESAKKHACVISFNVEDFNAAFGAASHEDVLSSEDETMNDANDDSAQ